ncbi:hypothetical protein BB560_004227, partial [Smittium megazygosporum]
YILESKEQYLNPLYKNNVPGSVITVDTDKLKLWQAFYLGHLMTFKQAKNKYLSENIEISKKNDSQNKIVSTGDDTGSEKNKYSNESIVHVSSFIETDKKIEEKMEEVCIISEANETGHDLQQEINGTKKNDMEDAEQKSEIKEDILEPNKTKEINQGQLGYTIANKDDNLVNETSPGTSTILPVFDKKDLMLNPWS